MSELIPTAIGELAQVRSGGSAPQDPDAFSSHGNPFVRAGSLVKLLNGSSEEDLEKIEPDVAQSHRLQLFPAGTVLFAKSGMSATKGHVYALKKPSYVVSHLAALVPHDDRDSSFLVRALERFSPTSLIKDEAYPSIRLGEIENMKIMAPASVDRRSEVAAILDKADALRRKRKRALELLDGLTQSIFLEMFGDPASNPKGFKKGRIGDLLAETQYGTSAKAGSGGEYPILRMGNITSDGRVVFDDLKYIDLPKREVHKYTVQNGDILFNRTNSAELVGKTAVFEGSEPYAFAGYLVRARPRDGVSPHYISGYLNSPHGKAVLRNMAKSIVGMANINAKEMSSIPILIPDADTQKRYTTALRAIGKHRGRLGDNAQRMDALFSSLQSRAFSGHIL